MSHLGTQLLGRHRLLVVAVLLRVHLQSELHPCQHSERGERQFAVLAGSREFELVLGTARPLRTSRVCQEIHQVSDVKQAGLHRKPPGSVLLPDREPRRRVSVLL